MTDTLFFPFEMESIGHLLLRKGRCAGFCGQFPRNTGRLIPMQNLLLMEIIELHRFELFLRDSAKK